MNDSLILELLVLIVVLPVLFRLTPGQVVLWDLVGCCLWW